MNLINSINIDLELDVPENEARSTCESLCDGQVLPALERVMHRFEEDDIAIEQPLVIELGDVSEGQLSFAVEDAFYRALAKHHKASNALLESAHLMAATKTTSEVFLEYLQFPVLPWDTEDVRQFDEQDMMQEAAQKASSSVVYLERIASLVMGDLETCKRFFDLPWSKEALLPILQQLLQKFPALQGEIYGRLFRLSADDGDIKSSLVREVFYYILSGVLFGNRGDAFNREIIAALLLEGKEGSGVSAILSKPFFGRIAQADGRLVLSPEEATYQATKDELSLASVGSKPKQSLAEIESIIAEWRDALKQSIIHDLGVHGSLIRLVQLVGRILSGEASFSQHVGEMERIIEELSRGGSAQLGQSGKEAYDPTSKQHEAFAGNSPTGKGASGAGTKAASLSEDAVVDIMATLSVLHDSKLKTEDGKTNKESLQQAVAAIIRKQPDLDKRIPVHNAGLVLFQPFLISFFDRLGLLESRKSFKSLESQLRAAHLLHELSGFGGEHLEHLLPLNKLLCGINIMFPIGTAFEVTEEEQRETEALLKAVIRNWSTIGKVSPPGFQEAFVKREGLLERSQDEWILRVESKGIDVLLDYIPWDIHTVLYPWNEYLIYVDWKA